MYYLGIDLGSSSIKISLVDETSGKSISVLQEPEEEMSMYANEKGWAEQKAEDWWSYVCKGIKKIKKNTSISRNDIVGI